MKQFWAICVTILLINAAACGVEFNEAQLSGKRIAVCRVNVRQERLQLFLRDDAGEPFKRFERLEAWPPRLRRLMSIFGLKKFLS